jgi:hypothetical protein
MIYPIYLLIRVCVGDQIKAAEKRLFEDLFPPRITLAQGRNAGLNRNQLKKLRKRNARLRRVAAAVAEKEANSLEYDDGAMKAALEGIEMVGSEGEMEEEDGDESAEALVSFGELPIR